MHVFLYEITANYDVLICFKVYSNDLISVIRLHVEVMPICTQEGDQPVQTSILEPYEPGKTSPCRWICYVFRVT